MRAGSSGGSTSSVRSSRPGRRSAVSTSHGWLVAASTKTPSLSAWAPSSSASSWLTTLRPPEWRRWLRFWPIASSSSRNSTHGPARRAAANASWSLRSDSPSHMSSTSLRPIEKKLGAELAGDGAGEERLAAAGRAVEQQPAAQRLAVVGAQLGVAQRREEGGVQARLDLVEPADVGERDLRALGLDQALGVELGEALAERELLVLDPALLAEAARPARGRRSRAAAACSSRPARGRRAPGRRRGRPSAPRCCPAWWRARTARARARARHRRPSPAARRGGCAAPGCRDRRSPRPRVRR